MFSALGRAARSLRPAGGLNMQAVRRLNLHEHESQELMRDFGIKVPKGQVAKTPEEAEKAAKELNVQDVVVKAQVLAGGRGLGKFTNGFQGGVHICTEAKDAREIASKMLGQRLVTKQTGAEGRPCNKVYVTERVYLRKESYFAILMDRKHGGPVLVGSPRGGVDIEGVAAATPHLIFTEPVDITKGPSKEQTLRLAKAMGFSAACVPAAQEQIEKLYALFIKSDATLVEINPFAETPTGDVLCVDAKLNFDDNAGFRQKEVFARRDTSQEDAREVQAAEFDLNYIGLDGNIGCLVNGAGLAMATMDIIKLYGGSPANFLDVGGGANAKQVTEAFKILNADPRVQAILVNIFGASCGTNVEAAREMIGKSSVPLVTESDLDKAAQLSVASPTSRPRPTPQASRSPSPGSPLAPHPAPAPPARLPL
eukprot:tig00001718_g9585.t1